MSEPISTNRTDKSSERSGNFTAPAYFAPTDYFLGIAAKAANAGKSSHVTLPGRGEVFILPEEGAYVANVTNMGEFCRAPAASFKVAHARTDEHQQLASSWRKGHLSELMWEAAFHASQGRLVGSRSNEEPVHIYDVIRFHRWPNLTRVSQTPNTMRICALLTRQPSSIMLVSRKLGIEHAEMYQVYSAACSSGIVTIVSNHMGQADVQGGVEDDDAPAYAPRPQGLIRALFTKIAGL